MPLDQNNNEVFACKNFKLKKRHGRRFLSTLGGMVYSTEPHCGEGSPLDAAVSKQCLKTGMDYVSRRRQLCWRWRRFNSFLSENDPKGRMPFFKHFTHR